MTLIFLKSISSSVGLALAFN